MSPRPGSDPRWRISEGSVSDGSSRKREKKRESLTSHPQPDKYETTDNRNGSNNNEWISAMRWESPWRGKRREIITDKEIKDEIMTRGIINCSLQVGKAASIWSHYIHCFRLHIMVWIQLSLCDRNHESGVLCIPVVPWIQKVPTRSFPCLALFYWLPLFTLNPYFS